MRIVVGVISARLFCRLFPRSPLGVMTDGEMQVNLIIFILCMDAGVVSCQEVHRVVVAYSHQSDLMKQQKYFD